MPNWLKELLRRFVPSSVPVPVALALVGATLVAVAHPQPASADFNPTPTSVGLYNFSTFTATTSSGSVVALPRDAYRAGLIIQNNGTVSVVVKPQGAGIIASNTDGVTLAASTFIQINPCPVDGFYVKAPAGTAPVIFIENIK